MNYTKIHYSSSYDAKDNPQYDADEESVDYDAEYYSGQIAPKTRPDRLEDYSLY